MNFWKFYNTDNQRGKLWLCLLLSFNKHLLCAHHVPGTMTSSAPFTWSKIMTYALEWMGKNRNKCLWGCTKCRVVKSGDLQDTLWITEFQASPYTTHPKLWEIRFIPVLLSKHTLSLETVNICHAKMTRPQSLWNFQCSHQHAAASPALDPLLPVCLTHFWCRKPPNSGSLLLV